MICSESSFSLPANLLNRENLKRHTQWKTNTANTKVVTIQRINSQVNNILV